MCHSYWSFERYSVDDLSHVLLSSMEVTISAGHTLTRCDVRSNEHVRLS